jgi:heme/copper-type cytochrome/quinol oxidase subunit 3
MCDQEKHWELVYNQRWLHARHQESQRLTFTSIFVLIFGGILTVSLQFESLDLKLILLIFLAFLSFFGMLIIDRWNQSFIHNREFVREIHKKWNIPDLDMSAWKKDEKPNEKENLNEKKKPWRFPATMTFVLFYSSIFSLTISFIVFNLKPSLPLVIGLWFVLTVCLGCYFTIRTSAYKKYVVQSLKVVH